MYVKIKFKEFYKIKRDFHVGWEFYLLFDLNELTSKTRDTAGHFDFDVIFCNHLF